MTSKNESNRRRKWAPKARTGCRTCKTRHVKCDEAKPVCKRCVLSGFRCDGYPSLPNKAENESPPAEESIEPNEASPSTALSVVITKVETPPLSVDSPMVPTPLIFSPSEPYVNGERRCLKFFIEMTAAMVSRSRAGPHFWQQLVPQAAWTYPSVRHAMLATAISCESLMRRESISRDRDNSELQVLSHTSKAVEFLLSGTVPLDVVLLTSATLGILDLFKGQWDTACTHVTSGARLAEQARLDPESNPFISFYCEAFASALPDILKRPLPGQKPPTTEKNSVIRLKEAVKSLGLAVNSFDQTSPKVQNYPGIERDRILLTLRDAKAETEWILHRWETLLRDELERTSPPDDEIQINLHRVESPWSTIIAKLNYFLDSDGPFDIVKFEVAMERTLPFYMLAKSGENVKMREDAVQLMYISSQIRKKRAHNSADQISLQQIQVVSIDDGS